MARNGLAWLAALGLLGAGTVGAQDEVPAQREAQDAQPPDDIPDHMEPFREVPVGDNTPYPQWEDEFERGTGGAEQAGTEAAEEGALIGEVVRAEEDRLWLWHGGIVLPITLDEETRFLSDREETLQPGREVRTSLRLEEDGEYTATSVEPLEPAPQR